MKVNSSVFKYILVLLIFLCTQRTFAQTNVSDSTSHPALTSFTNWKTNPFPIVSAHRGGPYPGYPENALESFEHVVSQIPAVIECDIAMTKDSVLILMHDKSIDRTTTGMGEVADLDYDSLKNLFLIDLYGDTTSFSIPLLSDVLAWGKDKALFTLDIKRGVPFHLVTEMIAQFQAEEYAAIITYSLRDAELMHALHQELYLSVSIRDAEAINVYQKSYLPKDKLLAFVGTREPEPQHYKALKAIGIPTILGTLGNLDRSAVSTGNDAIYANYVQNGANIIATDRPLEVAKVLYKND